MKKPPTKAQLAWYASDRLRSVGAAQFRKLNDERAKKPRCGAHARTSGEPCRQPAMANGRCRYHGGASGSGKNWHVPRWPKRDAADAERRLNAKLRDREKAARRRAKRLAKMSPERRAEHEAWQRSHKPGDPKKRAAERERRRQNQEARALIEQNRSEPRPLSSEAATLAEKLAAGEARLAALKAEAERAQSWNYGVFL